jgi:hypothetical protein
MSGDRDKQNAPEVLYGPEPRPSWGTPTPPKLGPLPAHFDMGSVPIGTEQTFLVAAPFMVNHGSGELQTSIAPRISNSNTPSAFRDQIGLDPDPILDGASAEAFHLASSAKHAVTGYGAPPPLRVRFKPTRPGRFEAIVKLSVVATDGTVDTKSIRIAGNGTPPKPVASAVDEPQPPKIVDDVRAPEIDKTLEGAIAPKKAGQAIPDWPTLEGATMEATAAATRLSTSQANGVALAADDITSYQRAAVPPSMFDAIIEVAFMMGMSGIAGVVANYLSKNLAGMLSKSAPAPAAAPPGPQPSAPVPETTKPPEVENKAPGDDADNGKALAAQIQSQLREGFRSAAKIAHKRASPKEAISTKAPPGEKSTNRMNNFFAEHRDQVLDRGTAYSRAVIGMHELLRGVEPSQARAAMTTLARGMSDAARVADEIQAHATKLEWIAAVARAANGATERQRPRTRARHDSTAPRPGTRRRASPSMMGSSTSTSSSQSG